MQKMLTIIQSCIRTTTYRWTYFSGIYSKPSMWFKWSQHWTGQALKCNHIEIKRFVLVCYTQIKPWTVCLSLGANSAASNQWTSRFQYGRQLNLYTKLTPPMHVIWPRANIDSGQIFTDSEYTDREIENSTT